MTYDRFEHLPVWQRRLSWESGSMRRPRSLLFAGASVCATRSSARRFRSRITLQKASNGETTQELLTFLYIARDSAGEVRSMLCLIERFPAFADLKSEISDLKFRAESISRQLRAWAESLQNSKITGHRYLNEGPEGLRWQHVTARSSSGSWRRFALLEMPTKTSPHSWDPSQQPGASGQGPGTRRTHPTS